MVVGLAVELEEGFNGDSGAVGFEEERREKVGQVRWRLV